MRKLFLTAALFAAFYVSAQTTQVNTKQLIAKDSFNLDGIWRKTFPSTNQVTGGVVTWLSGYTFAVSAAEYQIKNKVYKSASGTITLDAAHSTLPRIDVIGLNTSKQIFKITGTPSATPAIPQIDPATQVYLTAVFVGAGSVAPGGVSSLTVYNENSEWSHDADFPSISFTATATPQNGTNHIAVTGTGANDVSASGAIKLYSGSTYNYSDFSVIRFYIRLASAWTASASLQIGAGNGGEPLTAITAANGFNPSLTGVYQNISVPVSQIPKTGNTFGAVYLMVTGNGKNFSIDNIVLQGGIGGGGGNGYLTDVYKKAGTDSVFKVVNGTHVFAYLDTGTGGGGSGLSSLNGQTGGTQTFATSTGGSDFSITSGGNTHTFNLPDAGIGTRGLINTGTQSIPGNKSFIGLTNFTNQVLMNNGVASVAAITGLKIRYDAADYTGITVDNQDVSGTGNPSIYLRNNGGNSNVTGLVKIGGSYNAYAGANSFNIVNLASNPIGFATSNITRLTIEGNGDFRYNTPHGLSTSEHIPSRGQVDSLMNLKLADSAFDVVRPIVTGTQKLFNKISSTKLQIRDVKNSASVTWTVDADSNLIATAAGGGGGTFSGSIAANQVAFGTASNTLGGNNNLYTDGSHLSIGTTDLSKSFQIVTSTGGDLMKLSSSDANCDIVGSSSASAFDGSNRIRFEDGFRFIASALDVMKIKQNQNVKFFGGVEFAGKQDVTSGTATTLADNVYNVFVNPASVLASHTITMPAAPAEGQELNIFFGGTVASGAAVVTSLTISPNAGQTVYGAAITTANGGDAITYVYNGTTARWHRKK